MSRPAGRRKRHQAASHTRTPVCAAISEFSAGFEAGFAKYRSTVLIRPTKSAPSTPHQRFKNAALSEPTPNTPVVCCVLLKKGGDWRQTPRYRSTHSERARGEASPGEARSGQAGQERTWPRADAGPNGPSGMGWAAWLGRGGFRRRKAREIQGILIKITLTQTVIHTPQLPLAKQVKPQVSKK